MSVRTVLAVVLAVALCSVSLPAIDHARTNRAEYHAESAVTTVSRSMTDLADENAVPFGDDGESNTLDSLGARRVVSLSLPAESATTGTIEFVAVGGVPGEGRIPMDESGDVLAYRVGGTTHVRHVPFDVRVVTTDADHEWSVEPDGTPLVVRAPDRIDIALLLVEYRGKRTVLVVPAAEL